VSHGGYQERRREGIFPPLGWVINYPPAQGIGGILAWQVEGCLEWQRIGLAPPKAIVEATEQYLREQDDIGLFVDERCYLDEKERTAARTLYDVWRVWCETSGVYAGKLGDFVDRMKKRFKYTTPKNRGTFHGIGSGRCVSHPMTRGFWEVKKVKFWTFRPYSVFRSEILLYL